jgi:16S rRNA pseudouridine516 synthase
VPKLYLAATHDPVTPALIDALCCGVRLHDEPAPLAATHCRQIDSHRLEIVLEQGKYHQVKRMLAAAGNHCAALCRTAIGGLTLDHLNLAPGDWCYLEGNNLDLLGDEPAASV